MSVVYKQGISLNYFARPSSMRITNAIYDVIHFLLKKKHRKSIELFLYFAILNRAYFFTGKIPDEPINSRKANQSD